MVDWCHLSVDFYKNIFPISLSFHLKEVIIFIMYINYECFLPVTGKGLVNIVWI